MVRRAFVHCLPSFIVPVPVPAATTARPALPVNSPIHSMAPSFGCDERPGVFQNRRSRSTDLPTSAHECRTQIDENLAELKI